MYDTSVGQPLAVRCKSNRSRRVFFPKRVWWAMSVYAVDGSQSVPESFIWTRINRGWVRDNSVGTD